MHFELFLLVLLVTGVASVERTCSEENPVCQSLCDVEGPWPIVTITGPVLEWPCLFEETKVIACPLNQRVTQFQSN